MKPKKIKCKCGCGQYLKPNLVRELIPSKAHKGLMVDKGKVLEISGYGYANNGFFNTLRCGFRYAVRQFRKPSINQVKKQAGEHLLDEEFYKDPY